MNTVLPPNFVELIQNSDKPVLVDFYADWCGPCKTVSPVVSRIAKENKDRLLTIKINADRKPQIAQIYQISSVPTIMLFKNGKPVMRLQGAYPYEYMRAEVNNALGACRI